MRFNIIYTAMLALTLMVAGCNDDDIIPEDPAVGEGVSPLQFEVDAYTVSAGGSRSAEPSDIPEPEKSYERKIRDFWLFQFKADGTQLVAPRYYSIPTNGATLNEVTTAAYNDLVKGTPMTIFVVTNTGSSSWGNGTGFNTLAGVKAKALPLESSYPIQVKDTDDDGMPDNDVYIPMSGQLDNVTVQDNGPIIVPVTRMYAKVKIQVGFKEPTMSLYYADIKEIPVYCTVSSMVKGNDAATGEPAAVPFPTGTRIISRAFSSKDAIADDDGNKWVILYMPESIRGERQDADKATGKNIPEDALTIIVRAEYMGAEYYYTVYPGENITNNFNIRRNCVYRVDLDVRNTDDQHNPSSNCYVVKPGGMLSFEPYNRVEKGGGYDIKDYLNPDIETKRIARVGIIWQTKDCIGDNSNGDLVKWVANEQNPSNSKIIINKTGEEGNALVGAYNSRGEIIWSWHIWVTLNEPDNIANAIIYTTYRWDTKGIYPNERIPGYGIMPCNIGALDFRSSGTDMEGYSLDAGTEFPNSQKRTFGMLYQWGRKDPFPPVIYSAGTEDSNGTLEYEDKYTGDHYANDNRTLVHKTSNYNATDYLFYSVLGGNQTYPVEYSIAHPTVYMSGNTTTSSGNAYNRKNGDWCGLNLDSDGLWGGTKGSGGFAIKEGYTTKAHLYDNYGEKSIFDPCPKGWRVPPGDLWLGFTSTGLNPTVEKSGGWWNPTIKSNYEKEVNYCQEETGYRPGMSMYVQAWRKGPTVYFPLQGTRIYNGKVSNTGLCGNYHNATCDDGGRVNILHLHRNMDIVSDWTGGTNGNILFMIFEYEHPQYYSKSTAGPIRCVRDSR